MLPCHNSLLFTYPKLIITIKVLSLGGDPITVGSLFLFFFFFSPPLTLSFGLCDLVGMNYLGMQGYL